VVKTFAKHVALPKVGFIEYVKPMKYPAIMPACINVPKVSTVLAIKAAELMILSRLLHFLTKCRRISSHIFQMRVQKENAHLMRKLR
jgi:hypothetical protein